MTFPPIVERELRELARGVRFHWGRAVVAGFAVVLCIQWFSFNLPAFSTALGQESFHMLARLGVVLALGACIITADCISHERREGTLGLLFLTTLKGHDVVLGKFVAMGTVAFYALLGFAPVLMVPLMVGGVTGGEVARTSLALMNLMFFSLATGLWVSVRARNQFPAILTSVALLAGITLAPYFLHVLDGSFAFVLLSPVTSVQVASEAAYSISPNSFWISLGLAHLQGWLLVITAAFALRRNWREIYKPRATRRAMPQARRLVSAPRVLVMGHENRRRKFAPVARAMLQMGWLREMAWLAAIISVIGSLWNAFAMSRLGSVWAAATGSMVFTFFSSGLFAFVGGRFLFEARRSGELELLMVTPVGAKGIVREQRLVLLRVIRSPLYLVIVGAVAVAVGSIRVYEGQELIGLLLGLCATANAALGVLAMSWVGMWFGVRVNSSLAIVGCAVGLVEIAPIVLAYLLPLPFLGATRIYQYWPVVVPVLMVIKNLFFIRWAHLRLLREFRIQDRLAGAGFFRRAGGSTSDLPAQTSAPA